MVSSDCLWPYLDPYYGSQFVLLSYFCFSFFFLLYSHSSAFFLYFSLTASLASDHSFQSGMGQRTFWPFLVVQAVDSRGLCKVWQFSFMAFLPWSCVMGMEWQVLLVRIWSALSYLHLSLLSFPPRLHPRLPSSRLLLSSISVFSTHYWSCFPCRLFGPFSFRHQG